MSTFVDPALDARGRHDREQALLDAADIVADMAQRVQLNGPERRYASEKLSLAVYKAAEGLALCGASLEEVVAEVHRGHRHGLCPREVGR